MNHNMRRHKDPKRKIAQARKTTQAQQTEDPQAEDTPSPEDNPSGRQLKHRRPPQPRQPPQARGRCTRYVALHPLRGGAPEQKRCIAYGSGAVPQHTRKNAELAHRTTHRHTPPCATGPYWRQDGHAAHATTCTPAHSGPLRPTPTPPTPLHAKSPLTCAQVGPERHLTGRRRDLRERTRPPSRNTWKCPHQRVLSNSPRLPNVADSGSCVSESPA